MRSIRCLGPNLLTSCVIGPFKKIAIPIAALNDAAVLVADALHHHGLAALVGLNIKGTTGPHRDPACVNAGPDAVGHFGTHHVTRAEPMHAFFCASNRLLESQTCPGACAGSFPGL